MLLCLPSATGRRDLPGRSPRAQKPPTQNLFSFIPFLLHLVHPFPTLSLSTYIIHNIVSFSLRHTDKMTSKILGVYPVNPDLAKERAQASFPVSQLTFFLEGDEEKTKRRKELGKTFMEIRHSDLNHCLY